MLAHARALLTSSSEGVTHYIDSDLRDTDKVLAEAAQTLDLSQPVGVMLIAVLHLIGDDDDPYAIVSRLVYQKSWYRSLEQVTHFFDNLELVEPGVRPVPLWRPDSELEAARASARWGGAGRKN
jgi:S-adenosyl methyltransferase